MHFKCDNGIKIHLSNRMSEEKMLTKWIDSMESTRRKMCNLKHRTKINKYHNDACAASTVKQNMTAMRWAATLSRNNIQFGIDWASKQVACKVCVFFFLHCFRQNKTDVELSIAKINIANPQTDTECCDCDKCNFIRLLGHNWTLCTHIRRKRNQELPYEIKLSSFNWKQCLNSSRCAYMCVCVRAFV